MARPHIAAKEVKAVVVPKNVETSPVPYDYSTMIAELFERVGCLEAKIAEMPKSTAHKSIHKIETHSEDIASTVDSYNGMRMNIEDQVQSMRNAIKILPPNLITDGRQAKENVEAICGFKVDAVMMDMAYEGLVID